MSSTNSADSTKIAIVGMALRFPGANNAEQFWKNLCQGVESISFFSDEELVEAGADPATLKDPNFVKAGGVLGDVAAFAASFFDFNPREAEVIDPQQRIFLECAWEALESAGYSAETYRGSVGVYAGVGNNTYFLSNLLNNPDVVKSVGDYQVMIGNDKDYLPTRVSYKMNLKGPSVNVQTACSTSLVAVHLACQGLLDYHCDLAMAGGVTIRVPQKAGYYYQEGGIASPDGHCRAFDAGAQGTVGGNGAGVVVLKRLEDALAAGDHIYAVIKGSAINNDGSSKIGFTAPSVEGQLQVIAEALAVADVDPATIGYVETHGTATRMGDPIEISALNKAFIPLVDKKNFCAIGSVKTNIGHLDTAAGVAGLIKATLAVERGLIPPSLHFQEPNPEIDFHNSPFYVNNRLAEWKTDGEPRRACVSSFGIGGTNAHLILEQAPAVEPSRKPDSPSLLVLSAKTRTALEAATDNLANYLEQSCEVNLADVAYTLQTGRAPFAFRRAVVCRGAGDAAKALHERDRLKVFTSSGMRDDIGIAFMFSGQGSQHVDMGRGLYERDSVFKEQVDRCSEILRPHLGLDLIKILYPDLSDKEQASRLLNQTSITQPALFVIEYSLAKMWERFGLSPQAMIGHSIGEYVAACLAGVFTLDEALKVVAARGRLMQKLPEGAMMAAPVGENKARSLCGDDLCLAAVNAPNLSVLSGPTEAIAEAERLLEADGIRGKRLHTSHAFHSKMMEPAVAAFVEEIGKIKLKPPKVGFISNLTGKWITAEQATDPEYWGKHLRHTVRFCDGLKELLKSGDKVLLEIGPGQTLAALARQQTDRAAMAASLASLRHPNDEQPDDLFLQTTLAQLWVAGADLDWTALHRAEQRRRLPLPTYPFERERYWVEPLTKHDRFASARPVSGKNPDIADWFYAPLWKESIPPAQYNDGAVAGNWLVFVDECGVGARLAERIERMGAQTIRVFAGEHYSKQDAGTFTINPRSGEDYSSLLKELKALDRVPSTVAHLWAVTPERGEQRAELFEAHQASGFYSLMLLAQSLAKQGLSAPLQLAVISSRMHSVSGEAGSYAEKTTLLGPCKVIPQEYPNITCRSIDIVVPAPQSKQANKVTDQILAEVSKGLPDTVVAYRGNRRWVQIFDKLPLSVASDQATALRERGVYLITGGLGSIGLVLAEHLAKAARAKLALIGRTPFPDASEWNRLLTLRDVDEALKRKIRKLQELEALGAELLIIQADVSNKAQMREAVAITCDRFGELNGVIHGAGNARTDGACPVQEATEAQCEGRFKAKVYGLYVLEDVLADAEPDFCLLLSSLSSVLGGLGFAAYSAANIFMDAFADNHNRGGGVPWVSVNWDGWQFDQPDDAAIKSNAAELAITADEGSDVFGRILSAGLASRVIVSTADLESRIDQWIRRRWREGEGKVAGAALYSRPDLQTSYVAPTTNTEKEVVGIWQEALGIERVGVEDNFFDLGGHSLIATHLMARLRERFKVELPLRSIFETPTPASLSVLIEQYVGTPDESVPSVETVRLTHDPINKHLPFPLTDVQQAYWIGRSGIFEMGNVATHAYVEFESASLDLERFEMAFRRLIDRHDMLRAIVLPDGRQQILERVPPYQIKILDLRGKERREVSEQLEAVRQRMSHQILKADEWPLFEIRASVMDGGLVRLHTSFDLLISDARSSQVLTNELHQFYSDPAANMTPLEISFRDYVLAEVSLQETELYRRAETYWQKRVLTLPPAPELPLAKSPASLLQPHFVRRQSGLSSEKWARLKAYASQSGLTHSTVLLAAFAEVLSAWSKSQQFTINLTLFNRLPLHQQVNDLVGDFTSLTLLEVDNSSPDAFEVRARRIQQQLWDDLDYRYVGGVRVQRELARAGGDRSKANMPVVFTSIINVDKPGEEAQAGQSEQAAETTLQGEIVYTIGQTPQVWLDLQTYEIEGALGFNWDCVEELFPDGMPQDMFDSFCSLLNRLADEMQTWTGPERKLLPTWQLEQRTATNATESPVADDLLHDMFARQALLGPDREAVISSGRRLTYGELYRRSIEVARLLGQEGVRVNTLVAIVMEKGWEQIVGALGIQQAGAAYLPINASVPQERLWHLLERGEVKFVLTQSRVDEALSWPDGVRRFCVDDLGPAAENVAPLENVQGPEDLAYVIFTSGSTGQPKGVMIDHRGAVNTINDINLRFNVGAKDRVLAISSLSFDLSVYDIFGLLAVGGAIVIPDAASTRDPQHWLELVERERVTIWNSVPALMEMLVEQAKGRAAVLPDGLRLVMMSGDWIPTKLPDEIKSSSKSVEVISMGGATEASIWSIIYPIEKVEPEWKSIPYGRPMVNQTWQILNDAMEPCPVWVVGNLYIGGIGLAKGYWRDEEKTRQSFITHPTTGERLYRTGDMGRYLPDGNIEFLGREDFQVKVQGYRIELGEIESALEQHEHIQSAVVTAVGERHGNKRLVAYVVGADGQSCTGDDLRGFLGRKLPEYMVPSHIMFLDKLPLSSNGKVDRRALPEPERDLAAEQISEPTNETERLLAEIWSKVLGLQQVGIHDNFFELGGDSILSIRIAAKAGEVGLRISADKLFQYRTIAELAAVAGTSQIVEAEQGMISGAVVLTPIQHWLLEQKLADLHHWNQAVMLESATEIDVDAMRRAVTALLEHHDALRLRVRQEAGGYVQEIAEREEAEVVSFVELEEGADVEEEASRVQGRLDLERGPVVRVEVMKLEGESGWRVLIVIHHLAVDGVSWRVVLEDLVKVYESEKEGREARLGAKTTSYKEWARRLEEYAESEEVKKEVGYWEGLGRREVERLRVDGEAEEEGNEVKNARRVNREMSEEETRKLLREVNATYKTQMNEVILSGLAEGVRRWSGQVRVMVEVEGHGREQEVVAGVDLTRTVGWFTTIAPVLIDIEHTYGDAGEVLKSVREQLRGIPNKGLGFGVLKYINKDEEIQRLFRSLPEAEISFNYLGQLDEIASGVGPFIPARESCGLLYSPRAKRKYLISVFASVIGGRLNLGLEYSNRVHHSSSIEELADATLEALRSYIARCDESGAADYAPSDFPLAELEQDELNLAFGNVEFEE